MIATKKVMTALVLAALAAGAAFPEAGAWQMSAGFGGFLRADFQNYALTSLAEYLYEYEYNRDGGIRLPPYGSSNSIGAGFFAYVDARYAMLSLGMSYNDLWNGGEYVSKWVWNDFDGRWEQNGYRGGSSTSLTTFDIGLAGKLPVSVGDITLFSAAGVDLRIALAMRYAVGGFREWDNDALDYVERGPETAGYRRYNDKGEWAGASVSEWLTEVWFKFGFGADIPFQGSRYLRPMFFYGFGAGSKHDREQMKMYNEDGPKLVSGVVNHGLDFSLSLGFKF